MTTANLPTKRIRVNVSTSVKGVKTWDATIELTSETIYDDRLMSEALRQSDLLTAELDTRYPPQTT